MTTHPDREGRLVDAEMLFDARHAVSQRMGDSPFDWPHLPHTQVEALVQAALTVLPKVVERAFAEAADHIDLSDSYPRWGDRPSAEQVNAEAAAETWLRKWGHQVAEREMAARWADDGAGREHPAGAHTDHKTGNEPEEGEARVSNTTGCTPMHPDSIVILPIPEGIVLDQNGERITLTAATIPGFVAALEAAIRHQGSWSV